MNKAIIFSLCLSLLFLPARADDICTYQTYRWDTVNRQAVDFETVSKPYSQLTNDEIDPVTGCSVCRQDQRKISVGKLDPILVCKVFANQISSALESAIANGFEINQLSGYRVGRTRGDVDSSGKRTGFSNHSYGIAIDINSESNGLYENCIHFDAQCRLRRGGFWQPGLNPQSITSSSLLVRLMKSSGFRWGGEIAGRQKDFMHFSVSGY